VEVDEIVAREKTAHAFRTRRMGAGGNGPMNTIDFSTNAPTTNTTDRSKRNIHDMTTGCDPVLAPSILGPIVDGSEELGTDGFRNVGGFDEDNIDYLQPDKKRRQ
jgi:hypothetical protein